MLRSGLNGLAVLFGVSLVVFLLFNVLPGDPARMMAGRHASDEQLALISKDLHLDEPMVVRYLRFVNDLSPVAFESSHAPRADWSRWFSIPFAGANAVVKAPYFGRSYVTSQRVSHVILEGLPETITLAFAAILLSLIIGVPLGVRAARYQGSLVDRFIRVFSATGMAIPSFLAAILIGWVFGYLLHDFTGLSMTGSLFTYDVYAGREVLSLQHLVLPGITLAIRPVCVISQLTRDSMIDVLGQDYIRTARAKGLPERTVIYRHALINAISPVVTAAATWFAGLMAGSVFVEYVFGWKGLGHVIVSAIDFQDLPVIMGLTLVVSTALILVNWLLNITYPLINPTLRP